MKIDWATHEAAKYACLHWHYSKSMPTPPIVKIGVYEDEKFIGCVLFSRCANNNLGNPYGLKQTEVCELTRVALNQHRTQVSRIIAIALKFIKKKETGLRLCVSFADPNEGHHGGIYQAGGWIYSGKSNSTPKYKTKDGKILHQRQVSKVGYKPQYGTIRRVPKQSDCEVLPQLDKHRYLMPLDDEMRKQIEPLRKPYPKRVTKATSGDQLEGGGAIPTHALQNKRDKQAIGGDQCVTSIDSDAPGDQRGERGASPTVTLQNNNEVPNAEIP